MDEHTIRCRVGDISYVPLPLQKPTEVAGLITLVLPPDVKTGQQFRCVVRQHSRVERRILGLFDITIPVRNAEQILPGETRFLSVLKSIAAGVSPASMWFSVFERYLETIATRVRGLGGDPDAIGPSPAGTGGQAPPDDGGPPVVPDDADKECCREVTRRIEGVGRALVAIALVLLLLVIVLIFRS